MALHLTTSASSLRSQAASTKSWRRCSGSRFALALTAAAILLGGLGTRAQSPVANIFSTLAGGYTGTYSAGSVCGGANSGSKLTALDVYGNGCPAQYAKMSSGTSTGVTGLGVDGAGNVYFQDYGNGATRKIDARTGIVTQIIGPSNSVCSGTASATGQKQDGLGAGCIFANALGTNARTGMTVDYYGNVIISGYNSGETTLLCMATSPLCPNTSGRKQVGTYYRIAGCVGGQGNSATNATGNAAAYTNGDGTAASPYQNLAGDVAAWGLNTTTTPTAAAATVGTASATPCSSSVGEIYQARNASADKYGNVIIADSSNSRYRIVLGPASYKGITNPIFALIQLNPTYPTAHEGYIYPILGGFPALGVVGTGNNIPAATYNSPTAAGAACTSSPATVNSTDAFGSGCYYFQTANPASTSLAGTAIDSEGNVVFSDTGDSEVRVIYVGGTKMANIIFANTGATAVVGRVYAIQGNGAATKSGTPAVNVSKSSLGASLAKTATDGYDNLYLSDGAGINIIDGNTGLLRRPITGLTSGTVCSGGVAAANVGPGKATGDGCPAGQGQTLGSVTSVGLAIGVDNNENIYYVDTTAPGYIRKQLATTLYTTAVGSTFTQNINLHEPAGTTSITPTLLNASPGVTLSATQPVCTLYTMSSDNTADCSVTIVFTPTAPGNVSATLQVAVLNGTTTTATNVYPITGLATGPALVTDVATPSTSTFAAVTSPTSIAVDPAGNVYTIAGATVKVISSGGVASTVGTAPANANQVAVDPSGNVYVTSTGSASITKYPLTGAATYGASTTVNPQIGAAPVAAVTAYAISGNVATFTAANSLTVGQVVNLYGFANSTFFNGQTVTVVSASATQFTANFTHAAVAGATESGNVVMGTATAPQGIAFDPAGNMYIADGTSKIVYEFPADSGLEPTSAFALTAALTNPTLLALDGLGDVLIVDNGTTVDRVNASTLALTTLLGSVTPTGIAADTAGNVYVQDSGSKKVFEIGYQASTSVTVLTGETTPSGVGVDNSGQVYVADSGLAVPAILKVNRLTPSYTFPGPTGTFSGNFTNVGNVSGTGYTETDSSEFVYSGGCGTIPGAATPLVTGATCAFTVTLALGSSGQMVTSTTKLIPSSIGSLTFNATEPSGTTYTTTTTVTAQNPTSPVYAATGTEVTFTVSEVASDSTSQNGQSINVIIDSAAAVPYTLSGGTITVPVSGLPAGGHTITATYPGNGTYLSSTTGMVAFTIAKATPVVSWTPSATTQQYSASIGTGVLDATATSSGNAVPGYFLYTATNSSSVTSTVHAATYLPLGTYSLGVTFVPTDTTDYASGLTASVPSYTVAQASTTAAIGSTQTLVAADGSGNFTSVQAAVNTVPATGGTVYIKPGTYTENVAVVQPNTSLRGLGGDPTAVILTHSAGAFGSSTAGPQSYPASGDFSTAALARLQGTQLSPGSTQFTGDQGSATLLVNPGVNVAVSSSTLFPNNFYAENFTVINTWDTDTTTTTVNYLSGGICTANAGAAQTYNYLYINSLECASQAIAVADRADLSVYNNVYMTSSQDTLMADSTPLSSNVNAGSTLTTVGRQYYFRGKITGSTDYLFGNGAAVFDYASIYTIPHGSVSGTQTIEAQQNTYQNNSNAAYFSGYVANSSVFTSYTMGMSNLEFGRPYGPYSTWIMLNNYIDQVNPGGYIIFGYPLTNATYTEFNDIPYNDPTTMGADINGVTYTGLGGNMGAGVTGTRETASSNPGTVMASNMPPTSMTAAQATLYYPRAFLSKSVTGSPSGVTSWNHTASIAADVNAFVPTTSVTTATYGSSFTLLLRPQTPGLGAVTNGTYTIPTGTFILYDSGVQIASGALDASGETYYTSKTLAPGAHAFSWSYSGDTNFAASTTGNGATLNVTITAAATTTTLSPATQTVTYGQAVPLTATVASGTVSPSGNVNLYVDGSTTAYATTTLSSGMASFSVTGLNAGSHSFLATYAGNSMYSTSQGTASATVNQAVLTVTGVGSNRIFNQPNSLSYNVATYQYADTAATVFSSGPTVSTTATRDSVAGSYTVVPAATLSAFGSMNYTLVLANGAFTITGGAAQSILFDPLPNFASGGSYQLTARTTSGLTPSYTVTSGNASISGSVLTVNGAGPVTVQASTVVDGTTDYAAPTPVSRTFTAQ